MTARSPEAATRSRTNEQRSLKNEARLRWAVELCARPVVEFSWRYVVWALMLGGISAVSLPMGSWVGLRWQIAPRYVASFAAFGAGALLAALAIELVAPTVFALEHTTQAAAHGDPRANFSVLVYGLLLGGVLFVLLDQLVNAKGGFLRRTATAVTYFNGRRLERQARLVEQLSAFPVMQDVPASDINALVPLMRPATFNEGDMLFEEGGHANRVLFLLEGLVEVSNASGLRLQVRSGETLGLAQLVLDTPLVADAVAKGTVVALELSRENLERLRGQSPRFDDVCRKFTAARLAEVERGVAQRTAKQSEWLHHATQALHSGAQLPSAGELRAARRAHHGAPLAIWLGMLLDGIPESFVIGAGMLATLQAHPSGPEALRFAHIVPYTLIAGLFLSNFPEALASSSTMRMQGMKAGRILGLWMSLLVITALGAAGGFLLAEGLPHTFLVFAEGVAAGAMLTMIASAMIPEAVHLGSAKVVGLSTLLGFVAAISFTLLE